MPVQAAMAADDLAVGAIVFLVVVTVLTVCERSFFELMNFCFGLWRRQMCSNNKNKSAKIGINVTVFVFCFALLYEYYIYIIWYK